MYSYETRDVVVSKHASAIWACKAYPERRSTIEAARRAYEGSATMAQKELLESGIEEFSRFACEHIRESCTRAYAG